MSLFSSLFKSSKTPSYSGERPATSLFDVTGGRDYYQKLMERMAGRGVGYGDNYVSNANPQIANLRNTFESYNIPELTSELSLTGRRRGSGGFDQLSRAYRQESLDENDIMSRLAQRNAEASREDINSAISGIGDFNQREANTLNNRAAFDMGDYNGQVTNKRADTQANQGNAMRIGQAAVSIGAAPFTGGASLGYFPTASGSTVGNSGVSGLSDSEIMRRLYARLGQAGGVK